MNEVDKALQYIFILSLILVAVAYYAGTTKVLSAIGQQLGSVILISTGRKSNGDFAGYPQ